MNDLFERPELQVFAGPNGSGKSTITCTFPIVGEYINADDIQKEEGIDASTAAKFATALKNYYIDERKSFTFETVLSSQYNLDIIAKAKVSGYIITIVYVITNDPNINVGRVRNRVINGGHDVPEEKIRSRYTKSIENIKYVFKMADNFVLIDNSGAKPQLLLDKSSQEIRFFENDLWPMKSIQALIQ